MSGYLWVLSAPEGDVVFDWRAFESHFHLFETQTQGDVLVRVAELTEKLEDFGRALTGDAEDA